MFLDNFIEISSFRLKLARLDIVFSYIAVSTTTLSSQPMN